MNTARSVCTTWNTRAAVSRAFPYARAFATAPVIVRGFEVHRERVITSIIARLPLLCVATSKYNACFCTARVCDTAVCAAITFGSTARPLHFRSVRKGELRPILLVFSASSCCTTSFARQRTQVYTTPYAKSTPLPVPQLGLLPSAHFTARYFSNSLLHRVPWIYTQFGSLPEPRPQPCVW